jgi:hypothetical protein
MTKRRESRGGTAAAFRTSEEAARASDEWAEAHLKRHRDRVASNSTLRSIKRICSTAHYAMCVSQQTSFEPSTFELAVCRRTCEGDDLRVLDHRCYRLGSLCNWECRDDVSQGGLHVVEGAEGLCIAASDGADAGGRSDYLGQVVLSSLVRRFTVEPFQEYGINSFTVSKSPYL